MKGFGKCMTEETKKVKYYADSFVSTLLRRTAERSEFLLEQNQQHWFTWLGRVFSLYNSMVLLPSMIGLLFTGAIAEIVGVNNAFLISGGAVLLVGLASFLTRPIMRLGHGAEKRL